MLDGTNGNGNGNSGDKFVGIPEDTETTIAAARERAKALLAEMDELEARFRRSQARGTGDVTKEAKEARKVTLAERVEQALRQRPMTLPELGKILDESAGKINNVLSAAKKSGQVYNLGTSERPRWVWKIGEKAATSDLQNMVLMLISDQPLTTAELVEATGAKMTRVSGVLVAIMRSNVPVLNLGTAHRHRHFVVPANAVPVKLAPKAPKEK